LFLRLSSCGSVGEKNFDNKAGVFEDRMLRNVFGHKSVQVIGRCRELHNEELHDQYSWPDTNMSRTTG
jgi:hypothetical protein